MELISKNSAIFTYPFEHYTEKTRVISRARALGEAKSKELP
jgi:hypothetical protein